ncbi:MAG: DNA-binding MarR family transcriptional regulator [Bradymonadia bacterium]|jgi:DNA-binding MarR family transcriptional regulator
MKHVEQLKRASVAQLLFKTSRLLNEQAIALARERLNLPDLRTAHTTLFPHIDFEGTRLTELALRLGVSKQAVGQLVNELVEMGAFERVPDPDDGRARLVRFARGKDAVVAGLEVLLEVEAELRDRLGDAAIEVLHGTLVALEAELLDRPMLPEDFGVS